MRFKNKYLKLWRFIVPQCSLMMGGGSSSGSSDTSMERFGQTSTTQSRYLPESIKSLTNDAINYTRGVGGDARLALNQLVTQQNSNPGYANVKNMANVNPYSTEYKENTQQAYSDLVQDSLALARSGENNVLAPVARGQSFRESETIRRLAGDRSADLRSAQLQDAQIASSASQNIAQNTVQAGNALNQTNAGNMGVLLQLAELLGTRQGVVDENVKGKGNQTSSGQSFSVSGGVDGSSMGGALCCWIFLEAYRGKMPEFVRECRDEFAPENSARRLGYRRMADWLVPAMRKSKLVRGAVLGLMVKPMEFWGGYHKKVKGYRHGWLCKPVVWFWFKVWERLGHKEAKQLEFPF